MLKVQFVVVCCFADLTKYYRRDIVFYQGCYCTPEWRQSSYLCSARSLSARLICGLLHINNEQMRRLIVFFKTLKRFHLTSIPPRQIPEQL